MGITCTKLSLEQTDDKQLQSDAEDFNYSSAYEQLDVNYLPQFDIRKSTKATSPTEKILQQKQSLEKLRTISFRLQHSGHSTSSSSQDSSPVSLFPSKYSRTLSSSASTADSSNAPSIVLNTSNNSIILESSEDSSRVLTVNQALILACEQGDIDALVLMLVDPVYGMGINANLYNEVSFLLFSCY